MKSKKNGYHGAPFINSIRTMQLLPETYETQARGILFLLGVVLSNVFAPAVYDFLVSNGKVAVKMKEILKK